MDKLIKFSLPSVFDDAGVLGICWSPAAAPAAAISDVAAVQKTTSNQAAWNPRPKSKCVLTRTHNYK